MEIEKILYELEIALRESGTNVPEIHISRNNRGAWRHLGRSSVRKDGTVQYCDRCGKTATYGSGNDGVYAEETDQHEYECWLGGDPLTAVSRPDHAELYEAWEKR